MEQLKLSTLIYAPQQKVFDVLADFEEYPKFCDYVNRVARRGDGSEGTRYGIEFKWWKLTYTAWSQVESITAPSMIEWSVQKDIDAQGSWEIEDVTADHESDHESVVRVTIDVEFDVEKPGGDILDLPLLTSFDWVVKKVKPLIFEEARAVIQNLAYEVEGERRTPELTIQETPRHVTKDELESISG